MVVNMRGAGLTMIVLGIIGLFAGFVMDTSVSSALVNRVENIGLLSRQSSLIITSGLFFMTGCMLIGFAAVCDAVERIGSMIFTSAPRQPPPSAQSWPRPSPTPLEASEPRQINRGDGTKTCPKCYALASADATKCMRCGVEYPVLQKPPAQASASIGARVRHQTFGEGVIEAVEGDTATVRFDRREKSEPMNTSYLTLIKNAEP